MSDKAIRIIVADDHALFRIGLARMLNSFEGIRVVAEATNATDVLATIGGTDADLLVLDLSMPGATGTSLIEAARARAPALPILVLSMHDESSLVRHALKSGATGYITKNAVPEILATAIRELAAGGKYVEPAIARALAFDSGEEPPAATTPALSPREAEILRLIVEQGMSLAAIAEHLDVSAKTVTAHKANIMAKLGVDNNVELIRYAITHRLFD